MNVTEKHMVEIINPEFKRSVTQKLRLLKANPKLARLPEFKKKTSDATGVLILLLAAAMVLRKR